MMKNYYFFKTLFLFFGIFLLNLSEINAQATVTQTYNFTGGMQSFTVPACVSSITLDVKGSQGGTNTNSTVVGGLGGSAYGVLNVSSGDVLNIFVGGLNGYNGGGAKGGSISSTISVQSVGGFGGGATDVRLNGTALANRVIVAGGGGGAGGDRINTLCRGTGGGGGGGYYGGGGGSGWPSAGGGSLPTGGTQLSGGAGGISTANAAYNGSSGALGLGGNGGNEDLSSGGQGGSGTALAGGVGGGLAGTGGQYSVNWTGQSGAGGSSYLGTLTSTSTASGVRNGNGQVILSYNFNGAGVIASASPSLLCVGSSVALSASGVLSYTWSPGNSNSPNISASPTSNTSYTVQGTNSLGCISTAVLNVTVNAAVPSLTLVNGSTSVCPNNTVVLTAGGAINYSWTGGITNGITFTPVATSNYTLTGTNGCGSSSVVATISVTPLPVVALSNPSVVCSGKVASLSAGGATTYTWMPGNLTGASVIVSPLVTTIYTVTGVSGVCSGVYNLTLVANPNPTVTSASSSTNVCAGQTATFTAFGAASYSWQTGSTSSVIVVSPTTATAITVYGTNTLGCTSSTQQVVLVSPSPALSVIASNTLICLGGSVNFSATSTSNNYNWSTGATSAIETVSPTSNTSYTVSSSNGICASSQILNVSVFTQTLSVSPSTAICAGTTVNLNASGGTTYSWSDGSTSSGISVSPNTTTVYIVTANTQTNNMNCASSGTINITVNPNPTVSVAFTKTVICKGESSTMTASGASSYLWNTSDAVASISVSPTANTNYTVTGTNAEGCVNTKTVTLKVLPCVGINELNGENYQLSIYPNPSNGEFTIKSDVSINLNLINELGQTVRTITLNDTNKHEVNVSDLANGIYFIVGKNESVNVNQKIVVAK